MKKFTLLLIILAGLLKGYSQSEAASPDLPGNIFLNNFTPVNEGPVVPATLRIPSIDSVNSNPYALIGGGSKGIGYAIAEALAKRKFNLVLIARHKDSLIAAKNKLESKYGVHVELIQYDLSKKEAATEIAAWCTDNNIPLKVLCNVAGFGGSNDYLSLLLDSLR